MQLKVLSRSQIEQFIECGYTKLEEAFPRANALAAQDFIWERLAGRDIQKNDSTTWTQPMVHIKEDYAAPVFEACATERFYQAIEDLVGYGRYKPQSPMRWGWWPVNFAVGADQPWDVPSKGWHWDGMFFRHFVDSPEQGLLNLCIFSEIGLQAGSTLVAEGSHKLVARYLQQHSDGIELNDAIKECNKSHPWLAELTGYTNEHTSERVRYFMETTYADQNARLRVVETPASPGDVYMCHPFLYHSASQNHSGVPRFICNRTAPLKERIQLTGADEQSSPLEISIRHALTV